MTPIFFRDKIIQYYCDVTTIPNLPKWLRYECYSNEIFSISLEAIIKLKAIQHLIQHLDWKGKIVCYGDSNTTWITLPFMMVTSLAKRTSHQKG